MAGPDFCFLDSFFPFSNKIILDHITKFIYKKWAKNDQDKLTFTT